MRHRNVSPEPGGPARPTSVIRWERLIQHIAAENGVYVALAQPVGFEGGKGLQGASTVVGPDGEVLVSGPSFEEALVTVDLQPEAITRARADEPLLADLEVQLSNMIGSQLRGSSPRSQYDDGDAACGSTEPDELPGLKLFEPTTQQGDPLVEQRTKGDPAAPITIYEASDFQCSYCRAFVLDVMPQLDLEYIQTGKAQLVFVNLPLVDLHENAAAAHEFAMCAAKQDRFWPVHDLLFRYQEAWANSQEPAGFFLMMADSAGLDKDTLMTCLETGELRWLVQQEATAVAQRGIRSTPSFIIEQLMIPGWRVAMIYLNGVRVKDDEILKDGDYLRVYPQIFAGG